MSKMEMRDRETGARDARDIKTMTRIAEMRSNIIAIT
jgi:hypothetical protein